MIHSALTSYLFLCLCACRAWLTYLPSHHSTCCSSPRLSSLTCCCSINPRLPSLLHRDPHLSDPFPASLCVTHPSIHPSIQSVIQPSFLCLLLLLFPLLDLLKILTQRSLRSFPTDVKLTFIGFSCSVRPPPVVVATNTKTSYRVS